MLCCHPHKSKISWNVCVSWHRIWIIWIQILIMNPNPIKSSGYSDRLTGTCTDSGYTSKYNYHRVKDMQMTAGRDRGQAVFANALIVWRMGIDNEHKSAQQSSFKQKQKSCCCIDLNKTSSKRHNFSQKYTTISPFYGQHHGFFVFITSVPVALKASVMPAHSLYSLYSRIQKSY